MITVVRASTRDVTALCTQLALAFCEDPVAIWLFPNREKRIRQLETFFDIQVRHGYLPRGWIATSDDHLGCAMWISSWAQPLSLYHRINHLRIFLLMGSQSSKARQLTRTLALAHPREPHLYLGTIGTGPAFQGHGYASALLCELTRQADERSVGVYLECSTEKNVGFYERRGFSVRDKIEIPFDGPPLWLMWRASFAERR